MKPEVSFESRSDLYFMNRKIANQNLEIDEFFKLVISWCLFSLDLPIQSQFHLEKSFVFILDFQCCPISFVHSVILRKIEIYQWLHLNCSDVDALLFGSVRFGQEGFFSIHMRRWAFAHNIFYLKWSLCFIEPFLIFSLTIYHGYPVKYRTKLEMSSRFAG